MAEHKKNKLSDRIIANLRHEYMLVGRRHLRAWQVWFIVGIIVGGIVGIVWVANRSREKDSKGAAYFQSFSRHAI